VVRRVVRRVHVCSTCGNPWKDGEIGRREGAGRDSEVYSCRPVCRELRNGGPLCFTGWSRCGGRRQRGSAILRPGGTRLRDRTADKLANDGAGRQRAGDLVVEASLLSISNSSLPRFVGMIRRVGTSGHEGLSFEPKFPKC
jgi:hypothetical protein